MIYDQNQNQNAFYQEKIDKKIKMEPIKGKKPINEEYFDNLIYPQINENKEDKKISQNLKDYEFYSFKYANEGFTY